MAEGKNYLLIHGAYHGAWCWDEVKKLLEDRGHTVYVLDLPGHGDDKTNRKEIFIESYVDAVKKFVEENNLYDLIFVGHSFGGMIITKLIESIPERIERVILISAVILDDGDTLFNYFPESIKERYLAIAAESSDNSIPPNRESIKTRFFNDLNDDSRFEEIFQRFTPEPFNIYSEKVYLNNFRESKVPLTYLFCLKDFAFSQDVFDKMKSKLPKAANIVNFDSDHEAMFSHPKELVEAIINY